jgi:hypothetical protein
MVSWAALLDETVRKPGYIDEAYSSLSQLQPWKVQLRTVVRQNQIGVPRYLGGLLTMLTLGC